MDQTRENGQKLLIAALVLIVIFTIITILISEDEKIGFTTAVSTVAVALETFHFSSDFGILLLFFSLFLGVFAVYLLEFLISFIIMQNGILCNKESVYSFISISMFTSFGTVVFIIKCNALGSACMSITLLCNRNSQVS